jgi:hypothetical protein
LLNHNVLFDNNYMLLHDLIDIRAVSLSRKRIFYRSVSTAQFDAIGKTISRIGTPTPNRRRLPGER